jgi:hypothetical protein
VIHNYDCKMDVLMNYFVSDMRLILCNKRTWAFAFFNVVHFANTLFVFVFFFTL